MWGTNLQDVSCAVSPDRTPTAPRVSSDVNVPLTQGSYDLKRHHGFYRGITDSFFQTLHWFSDTPVFDPTCMAPAHTTPFWCHFVSFDRPRWTTFSCKCFGSFPGSIGASVAASQRVATGLQQSYSWMAWRKHWRDGR